jgi:hypothetical protein
MKFFNAVVVYSKDGSDIEHHTFRNPVDAFFQIFVRMSDDERAQVSAIVKGSSIVKSLLKKKRARKPS